MDLSYNYIYNILLTGDIIWLVTWVKSTLEVGQWMGLKTNTMYVSQKWTNILVGSCWDHCDHFAAHSQDPNILANFAKEVSSSYSNSKFVAESRVGLIRASTWSHMWSEISILWPNQLVANMIVFLPFSLRVVCISVFFLLNPISYFKKGHFPIAILCTLSLQIIGGFCCHRDPNFSSKSLIMGKPWEKHVGIPVRRKPPHDPVW